MQFKTISSVVGYTTLLLKKYNELTKIQNSNIYRIIEIKHLPAGKYKLITQIIGKSVVIECTPEEILANDRLLEGFSKKDIRTITYLACDQMKQPKYKIIVQEFCEKFNKIMFKIKETESGDLLVKTASQIVMDKNIINSLSQDDVNSISYTAGYESSQNQMFVQENNLEYKTKE